MKINNSKTPEHWIIGLSIKILTLIKDCQEYFSFITVFSTVYCCFYVFVCHQIKRTSILMYESQIRIYFHI